MTKKDILIIAVLCNVIVLAGIFATAYQPTATSKKQTQQEPPPPPPQTPIAYDEIDKILEEYLPQSCEEQEKYYTVTSGDTLQGIAKKQNVSLDRLLAVNGTDIQSAKQLKIGQKIRIPNSNEQQQ